MSVKGDSTGSSTVWNRPSAIADDYCEECLLGIRLIGKVWLIMVWWIASKFVCFVALLSRFGSLCTSDISVFSQYIGVLIATRFINNDKGSYTKDLRQCQAMHQKK